MIESPFIYTDIIYAENFPPELPTDPVPMEIIADAKKRLSALQKAVHSKASLVISPIELEPSQEGGERQPFFQASIPDILVCDSRYQNANQPASAAGMSESIAVKSLVTHLLGQRYRVLIVGDAYYRVLTPPDKESPISAAFRRYKTPDPVHG